MGKILLLVSGEVLENGRPTDRRVQLVVMETTAAAAGVVVMSQWLIAGY